MKKTLRFLMIGAFALFAVVACDDDEKTNEEPQPTGYDDSYYASQATIGSSSSSYTSTDEGGEITFGASGGEVIVNVSCGTDWTVDNSAPELFDAVVNTSAGTLTVSAAASTVESELTGTITVMTAAEKIEFATIAIVQEAYDMPTISVSVGEVTFSAVGDGLIAEIEVTCNLDDYDATTEDGWVTVEKTATGITITAEENEETEERETVVTVSCTDGVNTASVEVAVTQEARAYITVDTESIKFKTAGSYTINVESNFDVTCTSDDTWISAAVSGNVVTVTVNDNEGEETREGVLTVTAGEGENVAEATVAVSQYPASAAVMIFLYEPADNRLTAELPLCGTVDCTVDWGDGSVEEISKTIPSHTYSSAGKYTVKITGTVTELSYHDIQGEDTKTVTEVIQWGLTGLTSLQYAFSQCPWLVKVATDDYGSFEDVTNCNGMFNMDDVEVVPASIFDYATKVTNFASAFASCTEMDGESPYTEIDGKKVHLYERENYPDYFATPTNYTSCFKNCKKLTDLSDIPSGWQ